MILTLSSVCRRQSRSLPSFAVGVFCVMTLIIASGDLQAQCRPGWSGPFTTTMTIILNCGGVATPVPATVTYCIPGLSIIPQTQYMITNIQQIPPFNLGCVIDSTTFEQAGRDLIVQNPAAYRCSPGCPSVFPQFSVSKAGCWKEVVTRNNRNVIIAVQYQPCTDTTVSDCADLYNVCCDAGIDGICGTSDDQLTPFYFDSSVPECGSPLPCFPVCSSGMRAAETVICGSNAARGQAPHPLK